MHPLETLRAPVVGRTEELAQITSAVDRVRTGPCSVLIDGAAGIGKTTVWEYVLDYARHRGLDVLCTTSTAAEAKASFTALADLLRDVPDDLIDVLPPIQAGALRQAVFRSPGSVRFEERAVSAGTLNVLRLLSGRSPIVVALDDVQWIDRASARALSFAIRRLASEAVLVLTVLRTGSRDPVETRRLVPNGRCSIARLGPLSVDALGTLLLNTLDLPIPTPALRRLHAATAGNPLFALEVAQQQRHSTPSESSFTLSIPQELEEQLRRRLLALPASCREALGVAAAASTPTASVVEAGMGSSKRASAGLSRAAADGIVSFDGDAIRFRHPLLASVAYAIVDPAARRRFHRNLAQASSNIEERARHLALAATGRDERIASLLETAARSAADRGAPDSSADLLQLAIDTTPTGEGDDALRRTVGRAEQLTVCGDHTEARRLLEEALERLSPGPVRGRACWLLGRLLFWTPEIATALQEEAIAQPDLEPSIAASARIELTHLYSYVGNYAAGRAHAEKARRLALRSDDGNVIARAYGSLAWVQFSEGRPWQRTLRRGLASENAAGTGSLELSPTFMQPWMLMMNERLREARAGYERLLRLADERGDELLGFDVLWNWSELERRAGRFGETTDLSQKLMDSCRRAGAPVHVGTLPVVAYAEAALGDVENASAHAAAGYAMAEELQWPWLLCFCLGVLGFVELTRDRAAEAANHFARAQDILVGRLAWTADPTAHPGQFVPDAIEAAIAVGDVSRANVLLEWLDSGGTRFHRSAALGAVARYRGLSASLEGDLETAAVCFHTASTRYARLGMPFECARTSLLHGVALRRAKRRTHARRMLKRAIDEFEALNVPLWAGRARRELDAIGGRAPSDGALTPTEARVASRAAAGRTNREIAEELFISVHTVEGHLTHIYAKLAVRSKTELASVRGLA